jgi:hypothetical protein
LGEQPYAYGTRNIVKTNFFGVARIPPYGLFRHPNIFGGFLAVTLLWVLFLLKTSYRGRWRSWFLVIVLFMGMFMLFLTMSSVAWISFFGWCVAVFRSLLLEMVQTCVCCSFFYKFCIYLLVGFALCLHHFKHFYK